MDGIISFSIGVLLVLVIAFILDKMGKVYINKGWADKDTLKVDSPKFRVESVKRVVGCNNYWVAEYKATAWYRTKKVALFGEYDDVDSQTIIFYDEIGKYNIGDKLELTDV